MTMVKYDEFHVGNETLSDRRLMENIERLQQIADALLEDTHDWNELRRTYPDAAFLQELSCHLLRVLKCDHNDSSVK